MLSASGWLADSPTVVAGPGPGSHSRKTLSFPPFLCPFLLFSSAPSPPFLPLFPSSVHPPFYPCLPSHPSPLPPFLFADGLSLSLLSPALSPSTTPFPPSLSFQLSTLSPLSPTHPLRPALSLYPPPFPRHVPPFPLPSIPSAPSGDACSAAWTRRRENRPANPGPRLLRGTSPARVLGVQGEEAPGEPSGAPQGSPHGPGLHST